jgi:hypothetical protein
MTQACPLRHARNRMRLAFPVSPHPIATRLRHDDATSTRAEDPLRMPIPIFAKNTNGSAPDGRVSGGATRSRPDTQTRSRITRSLRPGSGGGSIITDESHATVAIGATERSVNASVERAANIASAATIVMTPRRILRCYDRSPPPSPIPRPQPREGAAPPRRQRALAEAASRRPPPRRHARAARLPRSSPRKVRRTFRGFIPPTGFEPVLPA